MTKLRRLSMMRTMLVMVLSLCAGLSVVATESTEWRDTTRAPRWRSAGPQETSVNPLARSMADFRRRVDEYMKLRDDIAEKLPDLKETSDPAKISAREKALGVAIAKARAAAKPGDVFGPDMSAELAKILAEDWKSRRPADRKALFDEIPAGLKLQINQPYPTTLPLVSVPPKLLAELPMLPEELEYRLADRYFLLRDRDANLIVDLLSGVLPARDR